MRRCWLFDDITGDECDGVRCGGLLVLVVRQVVRAGVTMVHTVSDGMSMRGESVETG